MDKPPTRKAIRIRQFDYASNGAYYVTICTKDRRCVLSDVVYNSPANAVGTTALGRPQIMLTEIGKCLDETIKIANAGNVEINDYVIMPNHFHMVCLLPTADDRGRSSLQQVIKNIKSFTTKRAGYSLWQSRFYEHIIRTRDDHKEIAKYIHENPLHWQDDKYYVENKINKENKK